MRRDDTRLVVLATGLVRQKVVKVGRPISDNEALAPQGFVTGGSVVFAGSRGEGKHAGMGVDVWERATCEVGTSSRK